MDLFPAMSYTYNVNDHTRKGEVLWSFMYVNIVGILL